MTYFIALLIHFDLSVGLVRTPNMCLLDADLSSQSTTVIAFPITDVAKIV